jgi:hypothetical protein
MTEGKSCVQCGQGISPPKLSGWETSGHLIFSIVALPGTRVCMFGSLFGIRALFRTKATPALVRGLSGSLEYRRSKFFLKHLLMAPASLSSRWVSCKASMAILFFLIVWLIMDHLSRTFMLLLGALDPRMFREAIVIFALFLLGVSVLFSGPGVGQVGWSLWFGSRIPASGVPTLLFVCRHGGGGAGWGVWAGRSGSCTGGMVSGMGQSMAVFMHRAQLVSCYTFLGIVFRLVSMVYIWPRGKLCYVLSEVYCPNFYSRFYSHWGIVGAL